MQETSGRRSPRGRPGVDEGRVNSPLRRASQTRSKIHRTLLKFNFREYIIMYMRQPARAARQDVSVLLLGNRHKLGLMAALATARDGRISLSELAAAHGVSTAVYYPPLKDLIALGLARQAEILTGQRRRWYERCGDPRVWKGLRALVRALEDFSPPPQTHRAPDETPASH